MRIIKVIALAFLASVSAFSQAEAVEGRDYKVLAQPLDVAKRPGEQVVIYEFFWYGCIHCYNMHKETKGWLAALPDDVRVEYVPVNFSELHKMHGRALYASQLFKKQEIVHDFLFTQMNDLKNIPRTEKDLAKLLGSIGIDPDKYIAVANSFLVDQKIEYAAKLTEDAKVTGTPAMLINGKYLVSGYASGITTDILDELIEKARSEK